MMPGMNPKMMKQAMKRMGIKQEEVEAEEVIIKTSEGDIIFKNPEVSKVDAMGQETWQVIGDYDVVETSKFNEDDVKTVVDQAGCSEDEAREALEKSDGDLAAAILDLKKE